MRRIGRTGRRPLARPMEFEAVTGAHADAGDQEVVNLDVGTSCHEEVATVDVDVLPVALCARAVHLARARVCNVGEWVGKRERVRGVPKIVADLAAIGRERWPEVAVEQQ